MDIRFQTGHEPKVKFSLGERSAAEKVIGLLEDYGKLMASPDHVAFSQQLSGACCDMGLLETPEVADYKTP
jgi:hypothetical protein